MSDEKASSWAIETESLNNRDMEPTNYDRTEAGREPFDPRDLRNRLRRSRGEDQKHGHGSPHLSSDHHSPTKSQTHQQRLRNTRDNDISRPNYIREKDGLSPLRSPLNPEQRSSRVNPSSRRRSMRNDSNTKKENEHPKSSSPSKQNRYPRTSGNYNSTLSMDVEEQRFRRRLDLPTETESDNEDEEGKFLNPEIEKDRIAIERREKQISYGKRTDSYKLYSRTVPKDERSVDRKKHPRTPTKTSRCSRRNWDAQISAWKKYTHHWANMNSSTIPDVSSPSEAESESKSSAIGDGVEEEDNNLDLNQEEEDESFLDGFEIDYEIGEGPLEAKSVPLT